MKTFYQITIINNNITRKTIPNFIQEDHYFYFHKTVNGSSTSTVDLSNCYNKAYILMTSCLRFKLS